MKLDKALMMKTLAIGLIMFFAAGCSPRIYNNGSNYGNYTRPFVDKKLAYFVWENDAFVEIKPENPPVSKLGEMGFLKSLYYTVKYPPLARENGVQGAVVISIIVDETGKVLSSELKEGIGGGCDEESMRAIQTPLAAGFEPFIWNEKPVKVRIDMPVKYRLE